MFGLGKKKKSKTPPSTPSAAAAPAKETRPGFKTAGEGCTALVTGSTGFCGARLVEMLLERGASTVICMDVAEPPQSLKDRYTKVQSETKGRLIFKHGTKSGDISSVEAVEAAFSSVDQVDIVFHVAALVGPFHPKEMYYKVNVDGTQNIIDACKKFGVGKLVNSSSPSTRFSGGDVKGLREDQMPYPEKYVAIYAETKATAERAVHEACCPQLLSISVAPHQAYGPHDSLFLPSLMQASGDGKLRIFGKGDIKISVCYVDNYAHGMLCGADALYPNSPALAKYYVVTDGEPQDFWEIINQVGMTYGFRDLTTKMHLPVWLLYAVAYVLDFVGMLIGRKFRLTPFTVRMLTIHRYFSIDNARKDLKYEPLFGFEEAWKITIEWFRVNWLPKYLESNPKVAMKLAAQAEEKED
uniref:3-beta hydroxysteroid dehydrogenase/isomerase domain-containing protein n=1 Tax=Grammatophora oceanica TaxID=210454 RepID=A0A7S1UTE7_9STRA|mmetsp:Transcript_18100/g.26861  ORF Transcript_18100/g.26861 Transcript_18100/m.26861 type:complete len:412 (+) Transcript_18100:131-1366(+)